MGKVTKSIPHLSKEEIQERIKTTVGFWRVQKWLVLWNALVDPRPAREIALHTGIAEQSVHNHKIRSMTSFPYLNITC